MSIFLSSTETLTVVLDAAPATNQLPCTASYVDQGASGGDRSVNTTGTTPVTLVGSPASSVERLVSNISIPNADTATRIVTVSKGSFRLCKITLLAGYQLYYDGHWMVLDASGNFLSNVTVTGGTMTANQGTAAALAGAWPVEMTDGTNVLGTAAHPIRIDPTGTTTQPVSLASTTITGTVAASQSGTWTVQPGNTANTTPWLVTANAGTGTFGTNTAQYGGTAVTLGQKVSASSEPVVIASDQSTLPIAYPVGTLVRTDLINSSVAMNTMGPTRVKVYGIAVYAVGVVLAAGSNILTLRDGGGTLLYSLALPTGTVAVPLNGLIIDALGTSNLNMSNAGNSPTYALTTSLTSGNFLVVTQFM